MGKGVHSEQSNTSATSSYLPLTVGCIRVVVTKDVPEKSIMVGIPAKRVGDATKGFKPYAVTDKEE